MPNISERAMLTSVRMKLWAGERIDRATTDEITNAKRAEADAAKVVKRLVPSAYIKPLRSQAERIRHTWHQNTLPWRNDGARILATAGFTDFMDKMQAPISRYNELADKFAEQYPVLLTGASMRLGDFFDLSDYPAPDSVRSLFSVEVDFEPIAANDWRVELDEDQMRYLRSKVSDQLNDGLATAMQDLVDRVREVVERLHDRCEAYGQDENARGLRTEVVDSVAKLADTIPKLNVTGDPAIEAIAATLKDRLTRYSAEELRATPALRTTVVTEARSILDTLSEYGLAA